MDPDSFEPEFDDDPTMGAMTPFPDAGDATDANVAFWDELQEQQAAEFEEAMRGAPGPDSEPTTYTNEDGPVAYQE